MVAINRKQNHDDDDLVPPTDGCPLCGERHQDRLVWIDDERVRCLTCKAEYQPPTGLAGR